MTWGQTHKYRYWFDDNYKSAVTASTKSLNWTINPSVANLSYGLHTINVQTESKGVWSAPVVRFFLKSNATLGTARWWVDEGERHTLAAADATGEVMLDMRGVAEGFHLLHYELLDGEGMVCSSSTRPFLKTMSPSMDILVSSNLERLLYLVTEDTDQVAEWMAALRETGRYDIGEKWLEVLRQEGFEAYFADEEETAREIRAMWTQQGYLADPHTAVALSAAEQYRQESRETRPLIALSTASPFKFAASMLSSLGESVPESGFDAQEALSALSGQRVPAPLAELRQKPERFPGVTAPADMREDVRRWLA